MTDVKIRAGTSAFTAEGWEGSFYPAGTQARDYLSYYATKFDTVEVDSTFYRTPAIATVQGWYKKTPADFLFALKVPQVITHEKVLVDCEEDLKLFLNAASELGEKLGPLLLQFGYFNKSAFKSQAEFLARLKPFLKKLPKDFSFALEIRNKYWLEARLVDLLRESHVALALIDQSWMPRPWEIKGNLDLITADLLYVRWLGDRKGIEEVTKSWDKTVVDRRSDLKNWVELLKKLVKDKRIQRAVTYANNHYAGHAPATVALFRELWQAK